MTYRLYKMTVAELEQLNRINSLIARGITAAVAKGAGTKADEGSIKIRLPAFYDIDDLSCTGIVGAVEVQLTLYVFGPHRNYRYLGRTLKECLDDLEADVNQWLTDEKLLPTEDHCHVLHLGRVLCGFRSDEPGRWPKGQHWVCLEDALGKYQDDVTCPRCLEQTRAARLKHDQH